MKKVTYTIQAGKFKAQCLKIMDNVNQSQVPYTITKHGKPIAMLVPVPQPKENTFGCLKDSIVIKGDILEPVDAHWEANE